MNTAIIINQNKIFNWGLNEISSAVFVSASILNTPNLNLDEILVASNFDPLITRNIEKSQKQPPDFCFEMLLNQEQNISENDNLMAIKEISSLKQNWDDYNAPPIGELICNKATEILKSIRCQPRIYPTASGCIHFEYWNKTNEYLAFDIYEEKIVCIYNKEASGICCYSIKGIDEINEHLEEFYGSARLCIS